MITSFDHVAITVKDLDTTIDWYVENLGFTVTRTIDNPERGIRIVFIEVASHAMLEFFGFLESEKAVEGRALKSEETGIKHLSFFVNDMEAMHHKLSKAGVKFLTKTSNRMVFKDLNGIVLELRQVKN
jgi:methylmalonyl-CoA/ethylmalonyl-CoA epimerase